MKIGICIFAYNRNNHLKRVLDGLKENQDVDELYIFQDGLKCEADREGWTKTQEVIKQIDWCQTSVYTSKENRGLAQSIVSGISMALEENEAVIILEDDCVPQPSFMSFMRQCFEKYVDNEKIYSISGYSWPIALERWEAESDVYFCGRPCPWGWGTWKDRWERYSQDYTILKYIKSDREASRRLAIWGDDLEDMLVSNTKGYADSWYVFWSLLMIKGDYYAVNPHKSLIENIGFDGTGVHCTDTDFFKVHEIDTCAKDHVFLLNEEFSINIEVKKAFLDLYGTHTINFDEQEKSKILIYGVGNFYKKNAKQIGEKYDIEAFVDKHKKDRYYAGIEIIHPKQMVEKAFEYIYIMIENMMTCNDVKNELSEKYGVSKNKIIIGRNFMESDELWEKN